MHAAHIQTIASSELATWSFAMSKYLTSCPEHVALFGSLRFERHHRQHVRRVGRKQDCLDGTCGIGRELVLAPVADAVIAALGEARADGADAVLGAACRPHRVACVTGGDG